MKNHLWLIPIFLSLSLCAQAPAQLAGGKTTEPQVIELGPNHRLVQSLVQETLPDGQVVERSSSYMEVASGMHYVKNGQWVASQEKFELFPDGAVATNGQHSVILNRNINTSGTVDLLSAEGMRLSSHLLGLAYTDMLTGQSILFSEPQDSILELESPNVVIFRNALTGPVRCDVRYTYTIGGFAQDIIIRERLPDPALWGLTKEFVRVEVWSEVVAPAPTLREQRLVKPEEAQLPMLDPGMSDETIQWGTLCLGPGRAFLLNEDEASSSVAVGKNFVELELRKFLIEKVDYIDIEEILRNFPQAAIKAANPKGQQAGVRHPSRNAALAAIPRRQRQEARAVGTNIQTILTASTKETREKGLVIDYQTFNVNTNDFTFKSDTTYYVKGSYYTTGTSIIEGSTVIKLTNGNTAGTTEGRLWFKGPIDCRTSTYRPAFFTGKDDNTVGETISGSTGNPTTNWYGRYVDITANANAIDLHDVRMRHAFYGIYVDSSGSLNLRHSQMSSNNYGITTLGTSRIRNVLFHDGNFAVGGGLGASGENCTFHRVGSLRSSGSIVLTNCMVIGVTNNKMFTGVNNVSNSISSGYFQTVGSSANYLIAGSTNRDSGTTNIDATLLADLKKLTTFPPIVLTNHFTNNTTLAPQAPRDTDAVDIGYHHPPLDFCWTALKVRNARLTLTNDVAVGLYGSSLSYGIGLENGAELVAIGLPNRMVRLLRNNLAQEHASGAWSDSSVAPLVKVLTNGATLQYRFVESVQPGGIGYHLYGDFLIEDEFGLKDCQLVGGQIYLSDVGVALTNCLLDRVYFELEATDDKPGRLFYNNLFRGGKFDASVPSGDLAYCRDNLFDQTIIFNSGGWTNTSNGYLVGQNYLSPTNATDRRLTSIQYEIGPLGWYYYPTNGGAGTLTDLVNAGSTNAHLLGFYHYTSATNQTKEATSLVDIGFRYIAVNSGGSPIDTDGDGWADWWEDLDGDGALDSSETDWLNTDSDSDGVNDYLELLLGRSPLVAGTTNDFNGTLNLRVYTPLR